MEYSHRMMLILKDAIYEYGKDAQKLMLFEEMAELQKEVCKELRGNKNMLQIIEEMADVYIMLEQMKLIYGIDSIDLQKWIDEKLERLEKRLNK